MTKNYRKAEELVAIGLATKNDRDCIEFEVDYGEGSFGWIYPDETFATIYYPDDCGEDVYDCGDIDLKSMKVIGCQDDYDIRREVR